MGAGENDPPDKGERRESETGLERGVGGGNAIAQQGQSVRVAPGTRVR